MNTKPDNLMRATPGFTLAELLVVVGVIALILTIIAPSIHGLFTAGADAQATGELSAYLGAARAMAVETQSYVLVHFQSDVDSTTPPPENPRCWAAIMLGVPAAGGGIMFVQAPGFLPKQFPGEMGFGQLDDNVIDTATSQIKLDAVNTRNKFNNFTTFNIIFGPDGSPTTLVNGKVPVLDQINALANTLTSTTPNTLVFCGAPKQKIWAADPAIPGVINEEGTKALCVFDYRKALVTADDKRAAFLTSRLYLLCLNQYTGQLIPSE